MTVERASFTGRRRSLAFLPVGLSLFILFCTVPAPAAAQARASAPASTTDAIDVRVAALERDADITKRLVALQKDIDEMKTLLNSGSRQPMTTGAWNALSGLGWWFVLAWGVVSIVREIVRLYEMKDLNATRPIRVVNDDAIGKAANERITETITMVQGLLNGSRQGGKS